jgi:ribosomal protein S18 acetylase RimI-like enzyme
MSENPFSVIPLGQQDRSGFTCGNEALNTYLLTQAGQDMKRRVAACFLAVDNATGAIAGYYTLSASHVQLADIIPDWQKKLPRYPVVPAARIGRLAIDVQYQGRKLGVALLSNAIARAMRSDIAAHMMVVEAKNDTAAAFYMHHGFRRDPLDPLRLFAPLSVLSRTLGLE